MARFVSLVAVLALLLVPLTLVPPTVAKAVGPTMVVQGTARGSGNPVRFACYTVADKIKGGGIATTGNCDTDGDGIVHITANQTGSECDVCIITQQLKKDPVTNEETSYLPHAPIEGSWAGPHTFENFLKPYLVVSVIDDTTGQAVEGACITVFELPNNGTAAGGCDGTAADKDGAKNGKVETKRLPRTGNYRVSLTNPRPSGYQGASPVDISAGPAETGVSIPVTLRLTPSQGDPARIAVTTIDKKSKKKVKGACYAIATQAGGAIGEFCDGAASDADGLKNGVVRTGDVTAGVRYVVDQTSVPRKYTLVNGDKEVTTVAGKDAKATFKNPRKR